MDFWYRAFRDKNGLFDEEAGGMNGDDIGVADEASGGKKGCRPGVDGRVDESGMSKGGLASLICFLRFSYEEDCSMEEVVTSSPVCWAGARGVLCEERVSDVRSISSP